MPTAQRIMFASLLLIALGSPVLTFNMTLNTNVCPTSIGFPFIPDKHLSLQCKVLAHEDPLANLLYRYWGQDSYGANNPSDLANWQQDISYYCAVCIK